MRGVRKISNTPPWTARYLLLLPLLFILAACAGTDSLYLSKPAVDLEWPRQSGGGPRVAWIKNIASYQDAGIAKGFWRRALEFFSGADEEKIVRPYGVIFDGNERLFIADPGMGVVHCMDIKGGRYTVIGGKEDSPLRSPIGLAEDEAEHLYITDSVTATVYIYDIKEGTLKPFLADRLKRPTGIVFNEATKFLYIVDTIAGQVVAVDTAGKERNRFGTSGEGSVEFNHPTDIAVDDIGQLYITDPLNFRIKVFTPEGSLVNQFGAAGDAAGDMYKPKGLAVDSSGHVYVCDAMLDTVQVFDDSGRLLLTFGKAGTDNGEFWMPSGLFIDRRNYIYVSDTYNRRIQVFRFTAGEGPGPGEGSWQPEKKLKNE
jgi:DNA-binding beta-propeller fold protein YncE